MNLTMVYDLGIMKKLLGIVVLGLVLTFSSNGISEEKSTEQTIIRSSYNEIAQIIDCKNLIKKI